MEPGPAGNQGFGRLKAARRVPTDNWMERQHDFIETPKLKSLNQDRPLESLAGHQRSKVAAVCFFKMLFCVMLFIVVYCSVV